MGAEAKTKSNDKPKIDKITTCPECGGSSIYQDYDKGELICENCGLVIDDHYIDQGPEWRAFDMEQEENRSRTGPSISHLRHDKGLVTEIDSGGKDSQGRSLSNRKKSQMYRLRKWQRRSRVSGARETSLISALTEIKKLTSRMGLPRHVTERAASIYRKVIEKNLVRGRSIKLVSCSVVYLSCRKLEIPRTLDEFARESDFSRRDIGRTYRFLKRELSMKLKPTKPQKYIQKFCNELGLRGEVKRYATDIINKAEEKGMISGKGPTGLAAAAIYIASIKESDKRTQVEIAEAADVTEVTVRNRYKEIVEELEIEIEV